MKRIGLLVSWKHATTALILMLGMFVAAAQAFIITTNVEQAIQYIRESIFTTSGGQGGHTLVYINTGDNAGNIWLSGQVQAYKYCDKSGNNCMTGGNLVGIANDLTPNYIPRAIGTNTLANGRIYDDGSTVKIMQSPLFSQNLFTVVGNQVYVGNLQPPANFIFGVGGDSQMNGNVVSTTYISAGTQMRSPLYCNADGSYCVPITDFVTTGMLNAATGALYAFITGNYFDSGYMTINYYTTGEVQAISGAIRTGIHDIYAFVTGNYFDSGYMTMNYRTTGYISGNYVTTGNFDILSGVVRDLSGNVATNYRTTGYISGNYVTTGIFNTLSGFFRQLSGNLAANYRTTGYIKNNYFTTGYINTNYYDTGEIDTLLNGFLTGTAKNNYMSKRQNGYLTGSEIIESAGNIGIGTPSPDEKLSVVGTFAAGADTNDANGTYSAVVGGENNIVNGPRSTIVGGNGNTITGSISFIGASTSSSISGGYAVILGGMGNYISGAESSTVGGSAHKINGLGSAIVGGNGNTITGNLSFILGGSDNRINSSNSFAGGIGASSNHDYTFIRNVNQSTPVSTTKSHQFVVGAPNGAIFSLGTSALEVDGVVKLSAQAGGGNCDANTEGTLVYSGGEFRGCTSNGGFAWEQITP